MFKQQLSPRSVHPYQTTVVPRSEKQFVSSTQQRTKYPWAEDIITPVSQYLGTDSSNSENAYHVCFVNLNFCFNTMQSYCKSVLTLGSSLPKHSKRLWPSIARLSNTICYGNMA